MQLKFRKTLVTSNVLHVTEFFWQLDYLLYFLRYPPLYTSGLLRYKGICHLSVDSTNSIIFTVIWTELSQQVKFCDFE